MISESSNEKVKPDLETLRPLIVRKPTKSKINKHYSDYLRECFGSRLQTSYERGTQSSDNNHNIKVVIETGFGSLNEFMLQAGHVNKYVTELICTDCVDDPNRKQEIGFLNLVTIMKDYNCCLEGLANYLTLPLEQASELVERRADNTYYSPSAIRYVIMNDCIKPEVLLDYSGAKLTVLRDSVNHFSEKYNIDSECVMDDINNEI